MDEQKLLLAEATKRRARAAEECKRIEKEMAEFSKDRDSKLKDLQVVLVFDISHLARSSENQIEQKQITAAKKDLSKAEPTTKNAQLQIDMAKEEVGMFLI
jgi:structural maintenance of chromosome 2